MDSDILATGEFMSEMSSYLPQYAGVFSGSPIWCTEEERVLGASAPRVRGQFNRTADGVCLGSSYFAIYDNNVLTEFIQSTGIDFRRYWWRQVPHQYQRQVACMGLQRERYDTGKLLNILLFAQGRAIVFVDSLFLQHIGGVSTRSARKASLHPRSLLESTTWRPAIRLRQWLKKLRRSNGPQMPDRVSTDADRTGIRRMRKRKATTAAYFDQLFDSLFDNQLLPALPHIDDPGTRRRIESVTASIVSLYRESRGQLARYVGP
jgi:hypothetical protein